MFDDILYLAVLAAAAFLAFVIGRKLAGAPKTQSKTTTFLTCDMTPINPILLTPGHLAT